MPDRLRLLDRFMPFYRVGPSAFPIDEETVVAQEASMRPVYSGTMPFQQQELPLPPGNWTVVSINGETSLDDGPSGVGSLLARLEGHRVTGLVLVRGSIKNALGTLQSLPPNRFCDSPTRYAAGRLAGPADGRDSCWFVGEATAPARLWTTVDAPPAARVGIRTMQRTGEHLPAELVGATRFHIDGNRWIEVTNYFDPTRNGVPAADGTARPVRRAMADPAMLAFVARLAAWSSRCLPLLDHLSARRMSAAQAAGLNAGVPD